MSDQPAPDAPIVITGLVNRFGAALVHDGLSLTVRRGEILGVVGGSGTGKSVLMRSIIGLQQPEAGHIAVLGHTIACGPQGAGGASGPGSEYGVVGDRGVEPGADGADGDAQPAGADPRSRWPEAHSADLRSRRPEAHSADLRSRWGVLFQGGALFSTLSVAENIEVPLKAFYPDLSPQLAREIAAVKVGLSGLPADAGAKYPSELSGGMKKRAALARALALDPELLFLDEPTAGLDPIAAAAFDHLIRELADTLGLTVFLITHDLDTLHAICDRVAVLAEGRVIAIGTIPELLASDHPWIQAYFNGPRGRAALGYVEGDNRPAVDLTSRAVDNQPMGGA